MAELTGPIELKLVVDGPGAIVRSLLSVCEVLAASRAARETLADCFPDFPDAGIDRGLAHLILDRLDLFGGEPILDTAGGAVKCILQPSDRYRMFVAALAADGQFAADPDFHGWPILSVATRKATVTEVAGDASPGDEGADKEPLSDG
ncbi:hypothetical protein [Sphingopyxis sp. GW247-27LB]|uniref:hypothetical protein n=1 Tax=Sphingopyxis sp. GW247-27LB TaxID=2012632 RepID=UPI000BA65ECD|nr:hypothetical protein [Sphingopyxis sp. GW247-27LB]PAL20226.1 hypothetical protein CD928_17620 [Sphingopyxis sp. GW247-27LB]